MFVIGSSTKGFGVDAGRDPSSQGGKVNPQIIFLNCAKLILFIILWHQYLEIKSMSLCALNLLWGIEELPSGIIQAYLLL